MKPSDVQQFLTATIPAGLPILITGPPGIGKSDVVAQAAASAGADLLISHPVVSDPTDAKGLPWASADGKSAHFLPFGDLAQALKAERPLVWFLDDLGQAPPAVQASFMQLLLARRVNGHALPDCVSFIAATNRRTDKASVSGILEPVKSRFAAIVEMQPDLDDFCNWGFDNGIEAFQIAFLRFRPELLHDFKATADLTNSPSPRTWHSVSKLLKLQLPPALELEAVTGAIGEGPAAEFIAFRRIWQDLPNLDGILMDPEQAPIPDRDKLADGYAIAVGLAGKAAPGNYARIARYAERLHDAGHGELSVLLVRDSQRHCPAICNTAAYIKQASSPVGQLIAGTSGGYN